jgi:hypothetical protein
MMFIYPYLVWYSITVDDIRDDLRGLHHTLYNKNIHSSEIFPRCNAHVFKKASLPTATLNGATSYQVSAVLSTFM